MAKRLTPAQPRPENAPKNAVKSVQMHAGIDMLGSRTSLVSGRNVQLEATSVGIKATGRGTGRTVMIPYTNIRGFELYPDSTTPTTKTEEPA